MSRQPAFISASRLLLPAFALGLLVASAACGERGAGPALDERVGTPCEERYATEACGEEAIRFCDAMSDETDLEWGPCLRQADMECQVGELDAEGCNSGERACDLFGGEPTWTEGSCSDEVPDQGGDTPLVLRFDDAPVELIPMGADGFDISERGMCDAFDWPTPATPWLAMDVDGSGAIERGSELFGSGTRLPSGARATHGFEALAVLDSDGDGAITPRDARWDELRLWEDHDGDRRGAMAELEGLAMRGLVRIDLDYRSDDRRCDARGNCEVERASFVWKTADGQLRTGEVVDLHLACQ